MSRFRVSTEMAKAIFGIALFGLMGVVGPSFRGTSTIGLLVMMALFFAACAILKRGGQQLSRAQRVELATEPYDWAGIALQMAVWACAAFARRFPIGSSIGAVVLTVIGCIVHVPKFNKPDWPKSARDLMMGGNLLLSIAVLAFVLLTAAGLR